MIGLLKVLEVLLLHSDLFRQSGCLDVQACRVDSLHVDVVAIDMIWELALLRVVVIDLVEEVLVEVGPFLKGELLAEDARGDVAGDEGSLDEYRNHTSGR